MPRIVAGLARGREVKTLKGEKTRPSGDRLKEAVFSILAPRLEGASFLDLFAGSGQMGLEAWSRGAASVELVESYRPAIALIRDNLRRLAAEGPCRLRPCGAAQAVRTFRAEAKRFDLIYFDPPWDELTAHFLRLMPELLPLLSDEGLIIVEADRGQALPHPPDAFLCLRTCHYGRAMVLFYAPKSPFFQADGDNT